MDKNIYVVQASLPPLEEYIEEIKSIWDTRILTHTGPKHIELEKNLCKYLNVDNCALFSNGHMALEVAIEVMKLQGEVITTPFTFASTTQAIVGKGLTPVFCDIDPDTYCIDVNKIEDLITDKTSALIPVHVYGNICDYKRIDEIAKKYNLKILYDAAHAFGSFVDGMPVGQLGDMSMFSFHATKVFNTVEGGGITYKESSLSKEFSAVRQFGMYGKEDAELIGTNAKMTEFHAAMGLCNLRHIDEEIAKRKICAKRYRDRLSDIKGITLCKEKDNVKYNYAYFPVLFREDEFGCSRDEICEKLAKNHIYSRKYFYPLTSSFTVYSKMFNIQKTPVAEKIAQEVLTLPLYSGLTIEEVDRVCDIIIKGAKDE